MKYHIRSIRLNGFDYSKNGYYFVTVCIQNKFKLFWKNKINNKRADTSVRPNIKSINPIMENKKTLGNIIRWFKTMTTNEYIKNIKQNNWPRFEKRLWQRDYYERIIRNEREYLNIKKYIKNNPNNVGVDRCVDPKNRK